MAKLAIAIGAGIALGVLGFFTLGIGPFVALGVYGGSALGASLGASVGFAAGGMIGNALFPTQLPANAQPPLITSGASNGVPIPRGWGSYRFAGNIIWSPGLKEVIVKTGGKGGMGYSQSNISYTASFAVAFGEGPGDILKVWFDTKVAYDITSGRNAAYYFDPQHGNRATLYPAPTIYTGTQTQMPDPLVQGAVGVNATPAFRPLVYAVWEDLLLSNFGNRIPNIQALIQYRASNSSYFATFAPTINFGYQSSAPSGVSLPTWTANSGQSGGQQLIDSNGNLQVAQNSGTTKTGGSPAWASGVGAITADGTVNWKNAGTPPYAITAGDTIIVYARYTPGSGLPGIDISLTSVTDSEGNAFNVLGAPSSYYSQQVGPGDTIIAQSFYAVAATNVLSGHSYSVSANSSFGGRNFDILVFGISGLRAPINVSESNGSVECVRPNPNVSPPITVSNAATGPCFALALFSHDFTTHDDPSGFGGIVKHGNGFESYFRRVPSVGLVSASVTASQSFFGQFAGYAAEMILFEQSNIVAGITPGLLNVDSGSAVGQNGSGGITSGIQAPTNPASLCLMISAGGSITPVGTSWHTYDSSLNGYGNISYFIMPATATQAVADASLSGGGNWATAVLSFGLIGNTLPVIVQSTTQIAPFLPPETFSFTRNTTNNNTILVVNIINSLTGNTDAFANLTDSQDNAYQHVHLHQQNVNLDIWVTQNVIAGPNTFTISGLNTGTNRATAAYEIQAGSFPAATLDHVITDICTRAGLSPSQIDVSQVANLRVPGYLISSQSDAKSALQTPLAAFFVDAVESDFLLKCVPRGKNTSVMTIPEADLGVVADKCAVTETIVQQQELPAEVDVVFVDPGIDWQQNKTQKRRSSRAVKTKQVVSMNLPMLMTPAFARAIAEKALYLAWIERRPFDFTLWKMAYAVLDPTDVVNFVYEGNSYKARVVAASMGVGYTTSLSTVSENTSAYTSNVVGAPSQGILPVVGQASVATATWLYDIPLLQDGDASGDRSQTGFYWGLSGANINWPGGVLYKSSDDTTFNPLASSAFQMTYGTCTTTLAAPEFLWTWDTVNTLTIQPAFGTLSGTTDLAVLNGANALLVGGELIQYANAVLNVDGTYTISRLLRGRRNTEYAVGTHVAGEWAVDPATGLLRASNPLSTLGMLRYYRGVSVGGDVTAVADTDLTLAGNDLKPASPVYIRATRDVSHNLTLYWTRRTRYAGDWLENTGEVPLNEDSEQYSIDIIKAGAPVRTITWAPGTVDVNGNPTASYTAAQQTTDFGTTQSTLVVNVYQVSGQVGRGYAGKATV